MVSTYQKSTNFNQDLNLLNLSVKEISNLIQERKISCESLLQLYFSNIEKMQSLNAFITVDQDSALQQAKFWDTHILEGRKCPALIGVLIAVKDNIHVAGFTNSAGTRALAQYRPDFTAPIIQKLIDQGAIVVGKAHMHELAFGVTGYNLAIQHTDVIGTRNARNPLHISGGSSSGSAVAVAAGMVPISIGTDTGASVRLPCALNGCVGFRPTVGRYVQEGITPISHTRDTAGPMAHTVSDIALIDHIITQQAIQAPIPAHKIRLGVSQYFWENLDNEVNHQACLAIERLKSAGVKIIPVEMPSLAELNHAISFPIVIYEGKYDLIEYLNKYTRIGLESLVDQIASPDVCALFINNILPELITNAEGCLTSVIPLYQKAIHVLRPQLLNLYEKTFKAHNLNALVFPTSPIVAPLANGEASSIENFQKLIQNTDPGSNIGLPGLSIPIGNSKEGNLAIGLEIDGLPHTDGEILAIGSTLEVLLAEL